MNPHWPSFLHTFETLRTEQMPFATVTVIYRQAPSSGKMGDKAIVDARGQMRGWIGGGCVQGIAIKEAREALRSSSARWVRVGNSLEKNEDQHIKTYKMSCHSQGEVHMFVEPVLPPPHLVVMGTSEIAKALVHLSKAIGYRVTACGRDADLQTFGKVDSLITQLKLDSVDITPHTYVVVATQGKGDEEALTQASMSKAGFVGFLASRKKMERMREYLAKENVDKQNIEAIRCPIGIDIQAKEPNEVAVSILAEIIEYKQTHPVDYSTYSPKAKTTTPTPTAVEAVATDYYINPVCGVPVDTAHPKHVVEHRGEKVYFCCDGCKVKFEKEPDAYVAPA